MLQVKNSRWSEKKERNKNKLTIQWTDQIGLISKSTNVSDTRAADVVVGYCFTFLALLNEPFFFLDYIATTIG